MIENKLTRTKKGQKYLKKLYSNLYPNKELLCLYNQLPNGLFNNKPTESPNAHHRIFTAGMYDIWGIDSHHNFCVFELKKNTGNTKLGVISELFFYAVYAHKILCNPNILHKNTKNIRGYDELYKTVTSGKINGVTAIFLLGEGIHSQIRKRKEELIKLLNTNTYGIQFDFIQYDFATINAISTKELE